MSVEFPDKFFHDLIRDGSPSDQIVAPGKLSERDTAMLRAIIDSITVGSRGVFAVLQANGSMLYLIIDDKPDRAHAVATVTVVAATLAEAAANG